MGIYEPFRQVGVWKETFRGDHSSNTGASSILEVDAGIETKVKLNEAWSLFLQC